jgi:hypothetical protein
VEEYFYAASRVWHTSGLRAGVSLYHYPDGQVEAHAVPATSPGAPAGALEKHVLFPDGRAARVGPAGVEEAAAVSLLAPELARPPPVATDGERVWAGEW